MKTRRRQILFCLVVLVLASCALPLHLLPAPEPRHHGCTLDEWLVAYQEGQRYGVADAIRDLAAKQGITNASHRYARQLLAHDHPLAAKVWQWLNSHSRDHWHHATASELKQSSLTYFKILRSEAAPAVPRLFDLWMDRGTREDDRSNLAMALTYIGAGGEAYIPTLVEYLEPNQDKQRRVLAVTGIWCMGGGPELAVPALQHALDDQDVLIAHHAALALGKYGASARSAISRLRALAEDPYSPPFPGMEEVRHLRDAAREAIAEIENELPPTPGKP